MYIGVTLLEVHIHFFKILFVIFISWCAQSVYLKLMCIGYILVELNTTNKKQNSEEKKKNKKPYDGIVSNKLLTCVVSITRMSLDVLKKGS